MADIETRSKGPGRRRGSPKVDMTAMVDVAFLLLTFFVLTTTLASPAGMRLAIPDDTGPPSKVDQEKLLTLILGSGDKVLYYHGMPDGSIQETHFGENGLRKLIFDHLNKKDDLCRDQPGENCWDPIFVLKPNVNCRYKNVVDAVDELRLANAPKYVFTDITPADSMLLLDL